MSIRRLLREHAFTLVELLVVILIVGLLAAIALPTFLNQQDKAKDSEAKQSLSTSLKSARAVWTGNDQRYPAIGALLSDLGAGEPQYTFVNYDSGANVSTGPDNVTVSRDSDNQITMCSRSDSGLFFCLRSNERGNLVVADSGERDGGGLVAAVSDVIGVAQAHAADNSATQSRCVGTTEAQTRACLATAAAAPTANADANVGWGSGSDLEPSETETPSTPTGPFVIDAFAGTGDYYFGGEGGPATQASFDAPYGVATLSDGTVFFSQADDRVQKVSPSGTFSTVAGTGSSGYSGDGGPGTSAQIRPPYGVAAAPDGTVYIADTGNNRIRKVAPNGTITTFAGDGIWGFAGDGGPATSARIGNPYGLAVGPDGSLYIADNGTYRVRKIAPNGTITTVAGDGGPMNTGDGGPATSASIGAVYSVAVTSDGTLYLAGDGARVRKVAPNGTISTVAGVGMHNFGGDGGPATNAALGQNIYGLAALDDGTLYISDTFNNRIRKVAPDGTISTVAGNGSGGHSGNGGLATSAALNFPRGLAINPTTGVLYVADSDNYRIRQLTPQS